MASSIAKVRIELTVDEVAELMEAIDDSLCLWNGRLDSIDDTDEYNEYAEVRSHMLNCLSIKQAIERASL